MMNESAVAKVSNKQDKQVNYGIEISLNHID
jgi:hypothetical protein